MHDTSSACRATAGWSGGERDPEVPDPEEEDPPGSGRHPPAPARAHRSRSSRVAEAADPDRSSPGWLCRRIQAPGASPHALTNPEVWRRPSTSRQRPREHIRRPRVLLSLVRSRAPRAFPGGVPRCRLDLKHGSSRRSRRSDRHAAFEAFPPPVSNRARREQGRDPRGRVAGLAAAFD